MKGLGIGCSCGEVTANAFMLLIASQGGTMDFLTLELNLGLSNIFWINWRWALAINFKNGSVSHHIDLQQNIDWQLYCKTQLPFASALPTAQGLCMRRLLIGHLWLGLEGENGLGQTLPLPSGLGSDLPSVHLSFSWLVVGSRARQEFFASSWTGS